MRKLIYILPILLLSCEIEFKDRDAPKEENNKVVKENTAQIVPKPDLTAEELSEVHEFPTTQAEFEGGIDLMYSYLTENMTYPVLAKDNNVQGKVFVQFIVWKDGSIRNVQVLKGIGAGCDEEAVRVISQMPNWQPARHNGEVVGSKFMLPVHFKLGGYDESTENLDTNIPDIATEPL